MKGMFTENMQDTPGMHACKTLHCKVGEILSQQRAQQSCCCRTYREPCLCASDKARDCTPQNRVRTSQT